MQLPLSLEPSGHGSRIWSLVILISDAHLPFEPLSFEPCGYDSSNQSLFVTLTDHKSETVRNRSYDIIRTMERSLIVGHSWQLLALTVAAAM